MGQRGDQDVMSQPEECINCYRGPAPSSRSPAGNASAKSETNMEEKSWLCTLLTQAVLCIAAYVALNLSRLSNLPQGNTPNGHPPIDMYFVSVAGGYRTPEKQILLLRQIVQVAKTYKAQFVVSISEPGRSDPLLQNVNMFPNLQNMPWYTTGTLGGQNGTHFLKKINLSHGQTIDIIFLDTVSLKDSSNIRGADQIHWLTRELDESESDWKVVVGFHQLFSCKHYIGKMEEENHPFKLLHDILVQHGVDVYISTKTYINMDGNTIDKAPSITAMNPNAVLKEESVDGFLLHRVSSLEMVTFVVKASGEIEQKSTTQQRGRAVM